MGTYNKLINASAQIAITKREMRRGCGTVIGRWLMGNAGRIRLRSLFILPMAAYEPASTERVSAFKGTLLLAGETRTYPCISWWSALQKSVQYIGTTPT